MRTIRRLLLLVPAVFLLFVGSAGAAAHPAVRVMLGRSERGRPIYAWHVGDPHGVPVLVVGCIHGTEYAGIAIARALEHIHTSLDLWAIPNLNPDGYAAGTRQNGRGVDLNRNWSSQWPGPGGRPWSTYYAGPRPFSERETRIARRLILQIRPRVTIWYHQHMDVVWAWAQSTRAGRIYAHASGMRLYHEPWLAGTAVNWQNHHLPGTASFVVELPAGSLSPVQVRRHVRAVLAAGEAFAPRTKPAQAAWAPAANRLLGSLPVSASVAVGGRLVYSHAGAVPRAPASNEKLLLSLALLDRFGPRHRIATAAHGRRAHGGVVAGNLWLVGGGDPELDGADLARLARRLRAEGIRRIRGSVVGVTGTFSRGRWAPGWSSLAPGFVALPTALDYDGNSSVRGFVSDPEQRAAAALAADLRALGVRIDGASETRALRPRAATLARVESAPLETILRRQNRYSLDFDAEVLAKLLGAADFGAPGTTGKGARAIRLWARRHGARIRAYDGSGLSYNDRVTSNALALLLARDRWAGALRATLAAPGEGTLAGRLLGLPVRAKTGTLFRGVSSLSGWVRLRSGRPATFSILCNGMPESEALALQDRLVALIAGR
jgi:protein MpaA